MGISQLPDSTSLDSPGNPKLTNFLTCHWPATILEGAAHFPAVGCFKGRAPGCTPRAPRGPRHMFPGSGSTGHSRSRAKAFSRSPLKGHLAPELLLALAEASAGNAPQLDFSSHSLIPRAPQLTSHMRIFPKSRLDRISHHVTLPGPHSPCGS